MRWGAENTIAISVENELLPSRVPAGGASGLGLSGYPPTTYDFFPFSGIHRPVVLSSVPGSAIEDIRVVTEIAGESGTMR